MISFLYTGYLTYSLGSPALSLAELSTYYLSPLLDVSASLALE